MPDVTPREEQKLRRAVRKSLLILSENKRQQAEEEQRLRIVLRHIIKEAKVVPQHTNTGLNDLYEAIDKIKKTNIEAYQKLTTTCEQRMAFVHRWTQVWGMLFSNDKALRNIGTDLADQKFKKESTEEEKEQKEEELVQEIYKILFEKEEPIAMQITDPNLIASPPEPTEEEKHKERVKGLVTSTDDPDITGNSTAEKTIKQTKDVILNALEDLFGEDQVLFRKWFFIAFLGTVNHNTPEDLRELLDPGPNAKPWIGHFQAAELELQTIGIATCPELLPPPETLSSLNTVPVS